MQERGTPVHTRHVVSRVRGRLWCVRVIKGTVKTVPYDHPRPRSGRPLRRRGINGGTRRGGAGDPQGIPYDVLRRGGTRAIRESPLRGWCGAWHHALHAASNIPHDFAAQAGDYALFKARDVRLRDAHEVGDLLLRALGRAAEAETHYYDVALALG